MPSYQESIAIQLPEQEPPQQMKPLVPLPESRHQRRKERRRFFASLRVKTTLAAIAIGTLPVLAIGSVAYFAADAQLRHQTYQNEQTNADDMKDKIFLFLKERAGDIDVLSNIPTLNNSKVRETLSRAEKEEALNQFARTYGIYDSIAVLDLKGNVIAQSQSEALPNHFDRDYFQQVLKTDRLFVTEPRKSETSEGVHLYLAAPVKDQDTNKTIAIIRTRIPIKVIQDVFNIRDDRQQSFYLLDAAGKIAVSEDNAAIGKTLEDEFPKLLTQIKKSDAIEFQSVITPHNRGQSVATYTPTLRFKEAYGLNWALVLSRPTEVAFAAETQLLWSLFLGTAAATLAVGAIAAFVANRATRPIVDAAKAVDKIGKGELDTRLQVTGEDELATLGANINDMASQLEVLVQEHELAAEQAFLLAKVTGSRTVNSQNLDELFNTVIEQARTILNADRVLIYRFNPDLSGYISAESVAEGFKSTLNTKVESSFIPQLLVEFDTDNHVVATNNILEANLDPDQLRLMERLQIKANLEVPILHEGQPFGLLIAHHCSTPHDWQQSEVNFFKQLSGQLGLSLDRVMLLEQTEQLADEQRQLKEDLQKRALELLMEVDPISKGDLTIRAKVTADEIGTIADSYNATVGNLRKIVFQVQEAASQVAQTTNTNEVSVQALSAEALRQAEEIAAALERAQEMAESVRLVAANAELAEAAVQLAAQTVQEGDVAMNRTVDGILAIRETVAETAKKVKHLGESSQKISTVVNLISTFAAQTNLLALNASIEAARAGEEGRGFAVVADEVRSLARQSAEATSEIEKLVAAIQGETNEVVAAMEAGTEQVVTGTKLVDETRQSLNKITAASMEINKLVEAISQATVVQSQASEAVTQTMTNVAAIADKTSKEANFVSSSFEQLRKVAQALQEDVGRFKVS
jgi:twitching motility protein PilJ/methyl-accepting chemotaxis protein PixJ